ncbi:MAG: hypothetical protein CBB71_13045 [Rhodopirellula sp. TMED11]|uniref:RNA polymerase sigma factor n=1 Tax=Stieleria bergensis TaxID=2528025 RepID=UPI000B6C6971|nr:MAG: hypothetical protein CBB71_13045 [Rhodopirellula sp. TMED11]
MNARDESSVPAPRSGEFQTTRWSLVISAGQTGDPDAQQALASLCESYWLPLYSYARRRVNHLDDAQEMTQAFFSELLEKNVIATATPERGRFRSYLLTAFKHFLSKQWEKAKAQKRGGGKQPLSLDFDSADSTFQIESESQRTADQIYDQQWAITLLGKVMQRLESDCQQSGKAEQFTHLKPFMIGDHPGITYQQVAQKLGLSEAAAKTAASRLRKQFGQLLRDEISQTVTDLNEIEDEIRSLFSVLSK